MIREFTAVIRANSVLAIIAGLLLFALAGWLA